VGRQDIVIQTWNCFGVAMTLGAVLRRRGPPDAHRLAHPWVRQALHEPDLVCMQELWIADAVELFDGLGHRNKLRDRRGLSLRPLAAGGSGLGLATSLPVLSQQLRTFRAASIWTDRLALKGMICARLRVSDEPVRELDVVTTHLQATQRQGSQRVREQQLRELREAVDELGAPTRAFLLCGDLNIDGLQTARNGEYERLRQLFPDFVDLGAQADRPTMCPVVRLNDLAFRYWADEPMQRLDYLLFRPPVDDSLVADGCELVLDGRLPPHGGNATFASDHFGLRARLRLNGVDHATQLKGVPVLLSGAGSGPSR
jgi:endonuclease/exonuclease/phosphatase family metal-dependent hydrolase